MNQNRYNRMKQHYMPPRSLVTRLSHIYNKRKRIAVGVGIMRWAINVLNPTKIGTYWAMYHCSIRAYKGHGFYNYKINGSKIPDIEILERVDSGDRDGDMVMSDEILRNSLAAAIQDSGAADVLLDPGDKLTKHEITRAIKEAQRWFWSAQGVEVIRSRTQWGVHLFSKKSESGDALLRYRTGTSVQYIDPYKALRKSDLSIEPIDDNECEGCGYKTPCKKKAQNGQVLCAHCATSFSGAISQSCKHLECGLYDCVYHIELNVNETLALEGVDDDANEWQGAWQGGDDEFGF